MAAKRILPFVLLAICVFNVNCSILCENGFCRNFKNDNTCATPAPDCAYNNTTHSGLELPSPTICNCCSYCLPFYREGQPCSVGGSGAGTTVGRCGHGLTCNSTTLTCVRMQSKCHDAQDVYDDRFEKGETGALESRPYCDDKGKYASFSCIPSQTCFCQSEDGERLFGEVVYSGQFINMPCLCSRMAHKIKSLIGVDVKFPVFGLRCTSDGNFNPVQCLNRTCYCVNEITGQESSDARINLDKKPISDLPCYDPDLDLFPQPEDVKPPYNYTTPCLDTVHEREQLIEQSIKDGYNVDYFSSFSNINCLPDGTFGRITVNVNGSKICINEHGQQIGDFTVKPDDSGFSNMDCKCAVTSSLLNSSLESPQCCKNGNFRSIQCHRGLCRCVDSDGRQIERENTDVTRLSCYTDNWRNCK